jgi:hypothetical protein
MIRVFFIVISLTYVSTNLLAGELKPFTSDGCSSFPDGTRKHSKLWLQCCTDHDYAYWKGGTYGDRKKADLDLKSCVVAVGKKEIAALMLAGVRVGGSPYFPTTFRWGYGWSYPKFYGELTKKELEQIKVLSAEIGR